MTDTKTTTSSTLKTTVLNFRGFDKNMARATNTKNRMEIIKEKIKASIISNVNYEKNGSQLPASMRILKDTDTHTIVTLRCGAYIVHKNTVLKNEYSHGQVLDGLQSMLEAGHFDEEITNYMNRKIKRKSSPAKKNSSKPQIAE